LLKADGAPDFEAHSPPSLAFRPRSLSARAPLSGSRPRFPPAPAFRARPALALFPSALAFRPRPAFRAPAPAPFRPALAHFCARARALSAAPAPFGPRSLTRSSRSRPRLPPCARSLSAPLPFGPRSLTFWPRSLPPAPAFRAPARARSTREPAPPLDSSTGVILG